MVDALIAKVAYAASKRTFNIYRIWYTADAAHSFGADFGAAQQTLSDVILVGEWTHLIIARLVRLLDGLTRAALTATHSPSTDTTLSMTRISVVRV